MPSRRQPEGRKTQTTHPAVHPPTGPTNQLPPSVHPLSSHGTNTSFPIFKSPAQGLSEGPARNLTSLAVAVLVGLFAALLVFAREGTGAWLSSVPFLSSAPSSSSSSSADGSGATTPVGLAPGTGGGGGNKKGPTEAASKPTKKEKAAAAPARPTEAASKPAKKEKAAATAGAGAGAGAAKKTPLSKEVKDPATGIVFQRTKSFPPSKTDLTCLGVGVRAKSLGFTKVNVYSVGERARILFPASRCGIARERTRMRCSSLSGDGNWACFPPQVLNLPFHVSPILGA